MGLSQTGLGNGREQAPGGPPHGIIIPK